MCCPSAAHPGPDLCCKSVAQIVRAINQCRICLRVWGHMLCVRGAHMTGEYRPVFGTGVFQSLRKGQSSVSN